DYYCQVCDVTSTVF
nr:immunoglobulin light chain junction region [Macaca mulatta]MOX77156.1 immunoglobulin light chain junction region [Macaca mulatta]